jgi:protein MpaA
METSLFAQTSLGLPVLAYHFQNDGAAREILILGGVHGDEIEGVIAAQKILQILMRSFPYRLNLTLVPQFNPDGVMLKTRGNGRGVDLNRNLPTKDWSPEIKNPRYHPGPHALSEPENQGLVQYITDKNPRFIYSLHSWQPLLNLNGKAHAVAEVIHQMTSYRIDDEIGYPTPGCLGTYAGLERDCPTLTYEIERGLCADKIISIHVPAILESLKVLERKS